MNQEEKLVKQEYVVDFHNEILENTNGMYAPIATIMNFLMQYTDRADILGFVLLTFKKLYNSFPIFRKNLEDPLISCFVGILKIYKREQQIAVNENKVTVKLTEAKNLYTQA